MNHVTIQRNLMGTQTNGTSPLPNGNNGISFQEGANNNTVGGEPEWHNTIAFNKGNGVVVFDAEAVGNRVTAIDTQTAGWRWLAYGSKEAQQPASPVITTRRQGRNWHVCAMCVIEVYLGREDEARFRRVRDYNAGNWSLPALQRPERTATATSLATNVRRISSRSRCQS